MVTIYSLDVKQIIINTMKIDWAGLAYISYLFLRWSWFGPWQIYYICFLFLFLYSIEFRRSNWLFALKSYCQYFFLIYFVIKIKCFWKSEKIYETKKFRTHFFERRRSIRFIFLFGLSINLLLSTTRKKMLLFFSYNTSYIEWL